MEISLHHLDQQQQIYHMSPSHNASEQRESQHHKDIHAEGIYAHVYVCVLPMDIEANSLTWIV